MSRMENIIGAVKNPIGLASLTLLIILSILSSAIFFEVISENMLSWVIYSLLIYSFGVIFLHIWQENAGNKIQKEKLVVHSDIKKETQSYENIHQTYPYMEKIINESIESGEEPEIIVLGLTLYQMWDFIKGLLKKSSVKNINILLCSVDSASPIIRGLGSNWTKRSDEYIEEIQEYKHRKSSDLKNRKIKINIIRYCHIPMIHGILINKKHLFLSYTQWDLHDHMEQAENFYVYYDTKTIIGKKHIEMFKNWIEHIKRGKCKELCLKYTVQTNNVGDRK